MYFSLVEVSEIFLLLKFGDTVGSSRASHVTSPHFDPTKHNLPFGMPPPKCDQSISTHQLPHIYQLHYPLPYNIPALGVIPIVKKKSLRKFQFFSQSRVRHRRKILFFLAVFLALISGNLHVTSATQESHKLFDVSN